jgi:hypothetical protein
MIKHDDAIEDSASWFCSVFACWLGFCALMIAVLPGLAPLWVFLMLCLASCLIRLLMPKLNYARYRKSSACSLLLDNERNNQPHSHVVQPVFIADDGHCYSHFHYARDVLDKYASHVVFVSRSQDIFNDSAPPSYDKACRMDREKSFNPFAVDCSACKDLVSLINLSSKSAGSINLRAVHLVIREGARSD